MPSPVMGALNTGHVVYKFKHLLCYLSGLTMVWWITWTTVCWSH